MEQFYWWTKGVHLYETYGYVHMYLVDQNPELRMHNNGIRPLLHLTKIFYYHTFCRLARAWGPILR